MEIERKLVATRQWSSANFPDTKRNSTFLGNCSGLFKNAKVSCAVELNTCDGNNRFRCSGLSALFCFCFHSPTWSTMSSTKLSDGTIDCLPFRSAASTVLPSTARTRIPPFRQRSFERLSQTIWSQIASVEFQSLSYVCRRSQWGQQ